jgi:hypothetical protein
MITVTLLIWELVPEEVKFFLLPQDVVDLHQGLLDMCNNKYINHVDVPNALTDELLLINWAVTPEEYVEQARQQENITERELSLGAQWLKYEYTDLPNLPEDTVITKVYRMGFLL